MSRAMFSGVAGMKAHQSKMDVIGNNIANVNTYGYKSQRAVFSDVYYQTLNAATRGTATKGGTNPSTVGVGSSLLGVQTMQTQSAMQNTGYGMDAAIAGEGYFQVMDGSGNVYYTKAGMLGYDANTGYLTDVNGNFVLGYQGTNKTGTGMQKIKLDQVGSVQPKASSATIEVDGVDYTVSTDNMSKDGNVALTISSVDNLPIGQAVQAIIANGSVNIELNTNEKFTSINDLNTKINSAIQVANGGKPMDCGDFTISANPVDAGAAVTFPAGGLTGAQIANMKDGYDYGTIDIPKAGIFGGWHLDTVGADFKKDNDTDKAHFSLQHISIGQVIGTKTNTDGTTESLKADHEYFVMDCIVGGTWNDTTKKIDGGKLYTGTVTKDQMEGKGKLLLKYNGSNTDTITMQYPNYTQAIDSATIDPSKLTYTPSASFENDYKDGNVLGGVTVSGLSDDTKVAGITLGANGALSVTAGGYTFSGSLDYDKDFKTGSIILTQTNPAVPAGSAAREVTLNLPSKSEFISGCTDTYDPTNTASDGKRGVSYSDYSNEYVTTGTTTTLNGYDVTNTEKSKNLGLGSATFALAGGTEGGPVSLNEISDIAIGSNGVVTVHNSDKGTVQVGQICIATFANPSGLQAAGNNYYTSSLNSGDPHVTTPGSDSSGNLKTSALEMSNVDLSSEFADMITTQRGFQANSRIITVSDTMLEELINLKR